MITATDASTAVRDAPACQTAETPAIRCEAFIEYDGLVAVHMHDPGGQGIYAPPPSALRCPNPALWEAVLPPHVLICHAHDQRGCPECDLRARTLWFCGRCLAAFEADDLGLMRIRRLR